MQKRPLNFFFFGFKQKEENEMVLKSNSCDDAHAPIAARPD